MRQFERVWAGGREPGLRPRSSVAAPGEEDAAVAAFHHWTTQLMAGVGDSPVPSAINLRKLRLTEGYREALRQAPGEQAALFAIWDAAYRLLERLYWEVVPPAIEAPPAPPLTLETARAQYKTMKRAHQREREAQQIHWHPLHLNHDPVTTSDPTE